MSVSTDVGERALLLMPLQRRMGAVPLQRFIEDAQSHHIEATELNVLPPGHGGACGLWDCS